MSTDKKELNKKIVSMLNDISALLTAGADEKQKEFNDFKKHILDECKRGSQSMQELYTWCQLHYNASTQQLDVFDKVLSLKKLFEDLASTINNVKNK